jgi:TRAP-type C4-dicarboxylate transport system permease small subunit
VRSLILSLDRRLSGLALLLAALLLALVAALGLWQVVSRFLLEEPSTWTEEAMRRLLIWMVMLGTAAAFRRGALVSVDLMLRLSRGAWLRYVRLGIAGVSLAYLTVIAWYGIDLAWRVRFQTFASIDMSMGWAYLALPVGALLSMLAVTANFLDPRNEELGTAQ